MSLDQIDFEVYLETPSMDHYRVDWVPRPGVQLSGMWVPAVVTGASGQDYLGVRGWSDFIVGMTHTVSPFCGFRALQPSLNGDPPHLFVEYSKHDWFEPYQYVDRGDGVALTYDSGRLHRDEAGCHWYDADGRWELHGETISKIFVVHVPEQEGIDREVYYRHELLRAHGTVDGDTVGGYLHQDFAYGPPGTTYTDLPIARLLEGMWVSWIHEHTDGSVGGGCFWQGRDELEFGPGYLLRDGETTAHRDVHADLSLNQDGKPYAMQVEIGGEIFRFDLDTTAGPLHYFGRLASATTGDDVARSWCWIEYAQGLLSPEILDAAGERFALVRAAQR